MLVKVKNRWFNPDAIDMIEPVSDNLGTEECLVRLRGGENQPMQMSAKEFADAINTQVRL